MKKCSKCGAEKPATEEFFRPAKRVGGFYFRSSCRKCDNEYAKVAAERRVITPEMRSVWTRRYYVSHPETMAEKRRHYRDEHPERDRATNIVNKAVARGTMVRHDWCEECGEKAHTHGHHDDYAKPREVRWLCPACHALVPAAELAEARREVERPTIACADGR